MREAIIAAGAALLGAGAVHAADLSGASLKDASGDVAVVTNWAGFYAGALAGFGVGEVTDKETARVDLTNDISVHSSTLNGAVYGGYFGYNWQRGPLVLGLEACFNGSSMGSSWFISEPVALGYANYEYDAKHDVNWYATTTGRLGYTQGRALLYGFGGVVWGEEQTSLTTIRDYTPYNTANDSATHVGWTAGAGIEYTLNDRLSTRVEYSHVNFGSKEYLNGADSVDVTFDTIKIGTSYKLTTIAPLQ